MKKLLLSLLFVASCAHAESWWETPTEAGGKIILTMQSADWCPKGFYIAYIETSTQDAIYGCWYPVNDRIHVKWNNGWNKIYEKEGWLFKNDNKK